ncbi:DUF4433 domain-containing protein, partial [Escherichia coli]|nr:DUF4433 domain-containing protein [Escherichia coli]
VRLQLEQWLFQRNLTMSVHTRAGWYFS